MDIIRQYFIGAPGGVPTLVLMFSVAILGTLAPIGLLVAFRLIALGRPIRSRSLTMALIAGPILLGIIFVARSLIMNLGVALSALILFSGLPVVGAAHMLHLGSSYSDQPSPA